MDTIAIIGAGIGGLALANGLQRHGFDVEVYERDTDLSRTGGYHLHLNPAARAALRALLEPELLEAVFASSASGKLADGIAFRDHRGRLLHLTHDHDDPDSVDIDRVTLRLLLAEGVRDRLRLGRVFESAGFLADGTVEARFADGSTATADLMVGAEGVGSGVAQYLAGGPTSAPIGLLGLCGRTRRADLPTELAELLGTRSSTAFGPGGTGLYVGYHDPVGQAAILGSAGQVRTLDPSYIWGAMVLVDRATDALRGLSGVELVAGWRELFARRSWSPELLTVLERADLDDVSAFRFHAGEPQRLAPWPSGRITALGDGVHAMPPTAGMGAATAIRDAAGLADQLGRARTGEKTLSMAVHDYEAAMRPYAAEAITASLRTVGWLRSTAGPLGSLAARVAFPVLAAISARRRTGRRPAAR